MGHQLLEDTAPERGYDTMCQEAGFEPVKPKPIYIRVESKFEEFRVDRAFGVDARLTRDTFYVEIDGVYHDTAIQRSKTRWRDEILYKTLGIRILHIDAALLTDRRFWPYVLRLLLKFYFRLPDKKLEGTMELGRIAA
jgi:hypothetical protein